MWLQKTVVLWVVLSFASCNEYKSTGGIHLKIENSASYPLSNVLFYTSEKLDTVKIATLRQGESIEAFLDMKKNQIDGHYILEYNGAGGHLQKSEDGYYSNGFDSNEFVRITVNNDTTTFKFTRTD